MTSILIIVEKPKTSNALSDPWKLLTGKLEEVANKDKNIQLLGANVLLISINNTLATIATVVPHLVGFSYKYSIFHEDIQWHVVPKVM